MKRLLVIVGLLALSVYPVKAGNFASFTDTGSSGNYHAGNVEVPTDSPICMQWAAAFVDGLGGGSFAYSSGPLGTVTLDTASNGNSANQSWSQNGPLAAGTYSYYQHVGGYSAYSNLLIYW